MYGSVSWALWFFSGSICTTTHKAWWAEWPTVNQLEGRTHEKVIQQQSKPNYNQRANISGIDGTPRASSSGDQSRRLYHWISPGSYHRSSYNKVKKSNHINLKKQKQTRRISHIIGRQRNNPELEGKKESSERVLNKIEAVNYQIWISEQWL